MVSIGEVRKILVEKIKSDDWTPVILLGDVGVGKTTVFRLVAKDVGLNYYSINVGYKDGWELKGYPVTAENFTVYMPFWWQKQYSYDSIIVFDDISNVKNYSVFDAIIEIIDNYSLNEYRLENVLIGFTANLPHQSRLADKIPEPILGRSEVYEIDKFIVDEWIEFMGEEYGTKWFMDIGGFLKTYPAYLYVNETDYVISPRTWTLLSVRLHKLGRYDNKVVSAFIKDNEVVAALEAYLSSKKTFKDVVDNWAELKYSDRYFYALQIAQHLNAGEVVPELKTIYNVDKETVMFVLSLLSDRGREKFLRSVGKNIIVEVGKFSKNIKGVG